MKTKTIKIVALIISVLSICSISTFAQTEDEIISNGNTATTNLFNNLLEKKIEEIKKGNIENKNKVEANKSQFQALNDSIKDDFKKKITETKAEYNARIAKENKEKLQKEDKEYAIKASNLLSQQIIELDKRISDLNDIKNDLIVYLTTDLSRRLDSLTDDEELKGAYKVQINTRISEIKKIKADDLMIENYPYFDKFSQYFGQEDSEENKNELNYKLSEKLKRKKEIALITKQNKLLSKIKSRFVTEITEYERLIREEEAKIKTSNDDVSRSDEIAAKATECRKAVIDFADKLIAEIEDDGKTKFEKTSTSQTRTKLKQIFIRHKLDVPKISTYSTNQDMVNNAIDYLTNLIGD